MKKHRIRLRNTDGRSYIKIGRFLKIPCSYEGTRYYRTFTIFGFRLTAVFCDFEGVVYIYPFMNSSFHFFLKIKEKSMKAAHYRKLSENSFDQDYIDYEIHRVTYKKLGYYVNTKEPETFNEKIIWIKLNEKDPLITACCDKYRVKEYVRDTVGGEYTLPVLKTFDRSSDLSFDGLPDRFVIKVNWSSGYNIIVKDRKRFNEAAARKITEKWMQPAANSYYHFFNYGYRDMKPAIYIEPYIEEADGRLNDYKFFINKGKLLFVLMASDRYGEEKGSLTYYDADLNRLPFTRGDKENKDIRKPENYDLMVDLAVRLAAPFKFVRVDFYEDSRKNVYVGEMTFYTAGGLTRFHPDEWDLKLGEMIDLE